MRDNMARMSKTAARKRLEEAKKKVVRVLWEADHHMSKGEMEKLNKIIQQLHASIRFNGLK